MDENTQENTKNKCQIDCENIIRSAVLEIINTSQGKKAPTYKEIAEITGLHWNTVAKYYKDLTFEPLISPQRSLTNNVVINLFNLTKKSPAACKLWLQVMENWQEKTDVEKETQNKITIVFDENE